MLQRNNNICQKAFFYITWIILKHRRKILNEIRLIMQGEKEKGYSHIFKDKLCKFDMQTLKKLVSVLYSTEV